MTPAACLSFPLRWLLPGALALATLAAAAQQPARPQARRAAPPPKPPVEAPLALADDEQKLAAGLTYLGPYECEFNETVLIEANPKNEGYVDVRHRKQAWIMKPVLSRTGALRLEDVKGRMLMLQIADKSMLMDTQVGRRLVDNCVHERQRQTMAARKAAGTETESIGIDPVKTAAAAAAAARAAAAMAAEAATGAAVAASGAAAAASAAAAAASGATQ